MRTITENGKALDAHFSVEDSEPHVSVTLESSGGTAGTTNARNVDYARGLTLLLERLKQRAIDITAIQLYPRSGDPGSILVLPHFAYPVRLRDLEDLEALRLEIGRVEAATDRKPNAGGPGNARKRIRLHLDTDSSGTDVGALERQLAGIEPHHPGGAPGSLPTNGGSPGGSQGYGLSQPERQAVDDRAMHVATVHFEGAGYEVVNVSRGNFYDLSCRSKVTGLEEIRVEVKGTTGLGETVKVTRNEVTNARSFPHVALAVVSEIDLVRGDPPSALGGKLRVLDPWNINDGVLVAERFDYTLPPAT